VGDARDRERRVTITLVFLAFLMGVVVFWLFRQSVNVQPWVAQAAAHDVQVGVLARPTAKITLVVFLAVATSLFALFISAYAMRINYLDWTPLPEPRLLTWNTAILVVASVAMQWAVISARRGSVEGIRTGLGVGGGLSAAFIVGQLVVWKQLSDAGYFVNSSAATAFFYLLTAVHGVHVLGGLVAWGRAFMRLARKGAPPVVTLSVELCAIYWHFLLAVWIALFAVLASPALGLAICTTPPAG
jgi:cytochrome c oxidase subunit 3